MARRCRPGSVRTLLQGSVTMLPGFTEGQWWVQDAAAALPARLFGDVAGKTIADLCAAPGGKTAQLAQAGARVVAVDRSPNRMARLRDNLARLSLQAETVVADAAEWQGGNNGGGFDGILVDAPCASTGTIRRHPDVGLAAAGSRYRRADGVAEAAAAAGGRAAQTGRDPGLLHLLAGAGRRRAGHRGLARRRNRRCAASPIDAGEVAGLAEIVTAEGDLRTLPCHLPHDDPRLGGLDGFYAARLVKS